MGSFEYNTAVVCEDIKLGCWLFVKNYNVYVCVGEKKVTLDILKYLV